MNYIEPRLIKFGDKYFNWNFLIKIQVHTNYVALTFYGEGSARISHDEWENLIKQLKLQIPEVKAA